MPLATQPMELPLDSTAFESAAFESTAFESNTAVREIRHQSSASAGISRDEMNLAEFPLAVLSTRTDPSVKTLEFRDVQRLRSGEVIERQWVITGADKFGLPTSTDDDVVLGLIRLSMDHGFRDRKVFFTRYELLRVLRWSTEGRSYSRLTKSLDRLSGVRIKATNAFYDNATKGYQTCNFGIIDAYELNDERAIRGGDAKSSFFIWSENLFESFKSGFIKKVDLELYFGLRSAVSRRLYRYLDKHFYYRAVVERPLMNFAFEKLGLARSYKFVSSVKQQLAPALKELVETKFLDHVEYEGQGSETVIRFYRGGLQAGLGPATGSATDSGTVMRRDPSETKLAQPSSLEQELLLRGLTARQAAKLIVGRTHEEQQKIRNILRYFDFLVSKSDKRVGKNPVGFLYRAVETPYRFVVPEVFERPSATRGNQTTLPIRGNLKRASAKGSDSARELYERYFKETLKAIRSRTHPDEMADLHRQISLKMEPLRRALEPASFQQALERLVDEELAKRSRVPDYREWQSQQPT